MAKSQFQAGLFASVFLALGAGVAFAVFTDRFTGFLIFGVISSFYWAGRD